jgi:general secretion pathway protein D
MMTGAGMALLRTAMASAVVIAVATGCATNDARDAATRMLLAGQTDAAVKTLDDAVKADPRNVALRAESTRVRELAVSQYLLLAENQRGNDQLDEARSTYLKLRAIDPNNARATEGLKALDDETRHRTLFAEAAGHANAGREDAARALLQQVLRENPQQRDARGLMRTLDARAARQQAAEPRLKLDLTKPISFDLRDATLRTAFEFLSRASGLNVFFDRDVKTDQRVAVLARDTKTEDLIQLILMTNQLERKIVSDNAILVYPSTPQKLREYQDLVSKTFYLVNADVRQVQNLIRTMVKTKDIHIDEKLNLLIMRDTPEAIRYAEKLIAAADLAEPEVMLQVEVMEIARNRLSEIGLRFPEQMTLTPVGPNNTPGVLPLSTLRNLNSGLVQFTVSNPALALNLRNQEGLINLLANPRIRVKNRERARILIGDRVPVITSTSTATGFVAESVNYLDVGIRLEVEPNIFLEDEVQIRVGLEVSNIAREIRGATGTLTYQVGTRNAATTLRLRDGETQVLAGLISDEDRSNAARLPGLGELPLAGRLFSSVSETRAKTEIVLLITPRILRSIERPDAAVSEFYAGTEAAVGTRPLFLRRVAEGSAGGATAPQPVQPPAQSPSPAPSQPAASPRSSFPGSGPSMAPMSQGSLLLPPADAGTPGAGSPPLAGGVSGPGFGPASSGPSGGLSPSPGTGFGGPMAPIGPGPAPAGGGAPPPGMPPAGVPPGAPVATPPGVQLTTLRLVGPAQVQLGETFDVALQLQASRPIANAVFQVQLDAAAVQYVDARAGSFFEAGGGRSAVTVRPDSPSSISVNVSSDGGRAASGQGDLVVLRLRAAAASPQGTRIAVTSVNLVGDAGVIVTAAQVQPLIVRIAP